MFRLGCTSEFGCYIKHHSRTDWTCHDFHMHGVLQHKEGVKLC